MNRFVQRVLLGVALATLPAFGFEIPFGEGTAAGESDFYLVPNGFGRLTLKYASIPIIDFDMAASAGARTWTTQDRSATAVERSDGAVIIHHRDFLKAGEASLVFLRGHLVLFSRDGDENRRKEDERALCSHPKTPPTLHQLWREKTAERRKSDWANWWKDSRLRLGYFNPNATGTLFAELAVLFTVLTVVLRRLGARIVCVAAAVLSLVGLLMSGSRGAFVAWIVGSASVVVCVFGRRLFRPKVLLAMVAVVVLGFCMLYVVSPAVRGRFVTNLLASDVGNIQRLRCWAAVPEMLAAAPGGWGEMPGSSYCDWFQTLDDGHRLVYLVNSHLTWLVQYGRIIRCLYVAGWLMLFALLFAFARDRVIQTAIGVWATFAVALWFSTVGTSPTLWILPAFCGVVATVSVVGGRRVRGRRIAARLCVVVVAGCALPFAVEVVGWRLSASRQVPVCLDGRVVRVGRGEARMAIVRDSTVLSGNSIGRFGHELRDWLGRNPEVGAVLVVDNPADLPPSVDRLVLAGKGASRYFTYRRERIADGSFCHAPKTVLLSPPFPPSSVPYTFPQETDVKIVIGEFAALRDQGYSRDYPWVSVVPGCELYVPNWTELTLADGKGGSR